jgi:hypothetical protein
LADSCQVVINKSSNDTKIAELLEEMQNSFPRLGTLMEVYPTPALETCVASVYKEIIMFAREASDYFARFSGQ